MTNEQFLQQFGHFADAPNGIQKLRELILQLAVQGKLVTQDSKDEPASVLLDNAKSEKALLIQKKIIKKGKATPDLDAFEFQFEMPSSWELCRFVDVAYIIRGVTFPASAKSQSPGDGLVVCLRSGNIQQQVVWNDLLYIPESYVKNRGQYIQDKDILISMANSYELVGKVALVNEVDTPAVIGGFIGAIRCIGTDSEYMSVYLRSPWVQLKFRESSSQTTNIANISIGQTNQLPIPIPPLAEQLRIVAKAGELMVLCDQLETERNARAETHQRLIRAVHHPLIEASDASATQTAWHRIRDNFANLYVTLESVQALRQTILQLAVQGELVEQADGDTSPAELLKKVALKRKKLVGDGKIRNIKSTPFVESSTAPYTLPNNWIWVHPDEVSDIDNNALAIGPFGSNLLKSDYRDQGVPLVFVKDIRSEFATLPKNYIDNSKAVELKSHSVCPGDLLITKMGDPPGDTAIYPENRPCAVITADCIKWTLADQLVNARFLYFVLRAPIILEQILDITKGAAHQKVSLKRFRRICLPLPPLEEQHRIVAKIDQLMTLCGQLEASIRNKNDIATCYTEAIVQQIAAA
ncbi:hypothetical protein DJ030_11045 [bacterium endosymbiont of Escarpia laminata]|nr:MAG: hypothetical protein DJ030_11045 [bacterium endosymbiont of Escarpia laminata]